MAKISAKIEGGGAKYRGYTSAAETLNRGFETDIPDDVMCRMIDAEAEVIESEQRKNALTMLNERGKSKGMTARSITRTKAKRNGEAVEAWIKFTGNRADAPRHRRASSKPNDRRAAEVAFVNEYGSRKTPARKFIQKAIDAKADEGYDKAEAIFDEWQKNQ